MNSATLTETKGRVVETTRPASEPRTEDGFHAWHFFVLVSILLATVAVVLARRSTPENLILLSFTIGAAGFAAAALYRMLLPLTSADLSTLDQPMTDRYRAVLERDKALTLRAIKELEFDHAMGKLSQKDFDEMAGRLRQRAVAIMKKLDAGRSYVAAIEQEVKQRLTTSSVATAPEPLLCSCGVLNDPDAVFCKKCGSKVRA